MAKGTKKAAGGLKGGNNNSGSASSKTKPAPIGKGKIGRVG